MVLRQLRLVYFVMVFVYFRILCVLRKLLCLAAYDISIIRNYQLAGCLIWSTPIGHRVSTGQHSRRHQQFELHKMAAIKLIYMIEN